MKRTKCNHTSRVSIILANEDKGLTHSSQRWINLKGWICVVVASPIYLQMNEWYFSICPSTLLHKISHKCYSRMLWPYPIIYGIWTIRADNQSNSFEASDALGNAHATQLIFFNDQLNHLFQYNLNHHISTQRYLIWYIVPNNPRAVKFLPMTMIRIRSKMTYNGFKKTQSTF